MVIDDFRQIARQVEQLDKETGVFNLVKDGEVLLNRPIEQAAIKTPEARHFEQKL